MPDNLNELLYDEKVLGFHVDDDAATGYQLKKLLEAELTPYQAIYDLLRERDDMPAPFALFLDPAKCPEAWLPYLAQYVGVRLNDEMTLEQKRAEITTPTTWRRGQEETIRVAIRRTLKPVADEELMVIIRARTPEPFHHYIRTLSAQTPNPARTAQVARENVPAWEALDYAAISGVKFVDIRAAYPNFKALREAFATFKALREVLPTELPEP